MLIIGHSHSECAFNDSIIGKLVNYSFSGETYFYNYYKLKILLRQNPNIKTVFIEFSNNNLDEHIDEWIWGKRVMSYSFPKYAAFLDFEGFKLLYKKNRGCFISCLKPSYKRILDNFTGNFDLRTKSIGGFRYLIRDKTDSILSQPLKRIYTEQKVSTKNLDYLDKMIDLCNVNGLEVYLVRSPVHAQYPGYGNEELLHQLLSSRYVNLEFLDFSDFPLSNSQFGDLDHLNHKGASVFSEWFKKIMDQGLLKNTNKQELINNEFDKLRTILNN
jgi:hypothetical protein